MSHLLTRGHSLASPIRVSVFLLISALAAGGALAAQDAGLAFVLGPGSHLLLGSDRVPLPAGARIELLVSGKKEGGRFPARLKPGGLMLPEIDLGMDGQRLRVRLAGRPSGWLTPELGGLAAELPATLQVEVADGIESRTGEYDLVLTTSGAAGEKVDYTSRSARLVAAGTIAADSPVAPGEPLAVVLEGAFEGLPADLR